MPRRQGKRNGDRPPFDAGTKDGEVRAGEGPEPGVTLLAELKGGEGAVTALAWSPDGSQLVSTLRSSMACLWDVARRESRLLPGASMFGITVTWRPNTSIVVLQGRPNLVLLDIKSGNSTATDIPISSAQISWSPDGRRLAITGRESGGIYVVNDDLSYERKLLLPDTGHSLRAAAWSSTSPLVAVWAEKEIEIWNYATGEIELRFGGESDQVYGTIAWAPDRAIVALAGDASVISIFDLSTGTNPSFRLEGHKSSVVSLAFSSCGRFLASLGWDKTIRLWSTFSWDALAVLPTGADGNGNWFGLTFHPDLPILAAAGRTEGSIDLWELDPDVLLHHPRPDTTERYTTAKIVLVGESGVGKTGLGYRLAQGQFKEHPSTHGQEFWVVDELGVQRSDGTKCEAVVWDLAGQPDYRLLHVLLIDDADAALIVFDASKHENALEAAKFWLRALTIGRAAPCPAILVAARCDRGTPSMTEEELTEFAARSGITGGFITTSALSGDGLDQLVEKLKALVPWNALTAVVTTVTFKAIKDLVLSLKEPGSAVNLLIATSAELRSAGLPDVDEDELWAAIRNLEASGFVKVLRTASADRVVLLKPELLNNLAASMVLVARSNDRGLGAIDEGRLAAGAYRLPEVDGLPDDDRRLLVDAAVVLFIERNVCFRELLGERELLIFPELINEKPSTLADDPDREDDVTYVIMGNIINVYSALVVLLGYTNVLRRRNQWQNQADYEMDGMRMGFRQQRPHDGELLLTLHYQKSAPLSARRLFQGLVEQFLKRRDISVRLYPRVCCPDCGFLLDRNQVIRFVDESNGVTFCPKGGHRIEIPTSAEAIQLREDERTAIAEQALQADRRSQLHVALAHLRAFVSGRDGTTRGRSCFVSYAWGDTDEEQWVEHTLVADLEHAGVEVILDRKHSRFGDILARFVSRIDEVDVVVVVGTPRYKDKYRNKVAEAGSVVASEVDLIGVRLMGTEERKATVIPILLAGTPRESFPPMIEAHVYADFVHLDYFSTVFDLALTIQGIAFDEKGVADLRQNLRMPVR